MKPTATDITEAAQIISEGLRADIFLYNGTISRDYDHEFIGIIDKNKKHANAMVLLVTNGGDPDAGYKIARHLQYRYDTYTVLVSGMCKSAGTLLAVGAHELVFSPYGELGPLDIQAIKADDLAARQSGLTIQESIESLAKAAVAKHGQIFSAIIRETEAIVSFPTAAKASSDLVTGLFSPIFAQIDPYDVGDKARAMRIATDYGRRLAANTNNLKKNALDTLTSTYPSHSFVIDRVEAGDLFERVREASVTEMKLIAILDPITRMESGRTKPVMLCLSSEQEPQNAEVREGSPKPEGGKGKPEKATGRAKRTTNSPPARNGGGSQGRMGNN